MPDGNKKLISSQLFIFLILRKVSQIRVCRDDVDENNDKGTW